MKFRTRLITGYMVIYLIICSLIGIVIYQNSFRYEERIRTSGLQVSASEVVSMLDDRLDRMDAIIMYLISDGDTLDDITMLGIDNTSIPITYIPNALSEMVKAMNTVYILDNSYRTVFFNENGYYVTSFVVNEKINHLSGQTEMLEASYLEEAVAAKGKTILVGAHRDAWGDSQKRVFSVIKKLQGHQMGYLEVENTMESLKALTVSNPDIEFTVKMENGEILYSSGENPPSENEKNYQLSSSEYGYIVETYIRSSAIQNSETRLALLSVLFALLLLLVGLIPIVIYAYFLTKPLEKLKHIMDQTNLENLQLENSPEEMQQEKKLQEEEVKKISTKGSDEFKALAHSYFNMTERLGQAIKEEERAVTLQVQAQYDTLQAQINPHFLYNVLNIISARGVYDDDENICEMCDALAEMLRYSTGTRERIALIRMEQEYLKRYFYLLQMRYGDKIQFQMEIPEAILEQRLPKLTLHQFVENAYSHGFGDRKSVMRIEVKGVIEKDRWYILVKDNGQGIREEELEKINRRFREVYQMIQVNRNSLEMEIGGMGLANTYSRCLMLYGDNLIFEIHNADQGLEVKIGVKKYV